MNAHTRRNIEIQQIYHYLRNHRKHTADYAMGFLKKNYFFDEDSNRIYHILGIELKQETLVFLDKNMGSVIYQAVMDGRYQEDI